jgi:hypothetical protein
LTCFMINSTAPAEASAGVFIQPKVLLEEGAELVEEAVVPGGITAAGTRQGRSGRD